MIKNQKLIWLNKAFLPLFVMLFLITQNNFSAAAEIRVPDCPSISWTLPSSIDEPRVLGYYRAIDKYYYRVDSLTKKEVSSHSSVIGCYISHEVNSNFEEAKWDVGVIDRDTSGYFWKDAAGRTLRLDSDFTANRFVTSADNPYFVFGKYYELTVPFNSNKPSTCKLPSFGRFLSPGFSRLGFKMYGKTEIDYRVIVPEFIDDQIKINPKVTVEALNLSRIQDYYSTQSYGKVVLKFSLQDRTFRLPGKSSDYIDNNSSGNTKVYQLMRLAYNEFRQVNTAIEFDGLIFALPREYSNPHAGFSANLSVLTSKYFNDALIPITWMGSMPHNWSDLDAPPWKVLAHEIGHNLGLADLYATAGNSQKIDNSSGRTIGPFDMMGSINAAGNEFTFWNRWLLGWIQDSQVACISDLNGIQSVSLTSVSKSGGGTKGIVIPTSTSTALLIESRRAQGFDQKLKPDEVGLVVYAIDTKIESGAGPIKVIPKENQYSSVPFSVALPDNVRFLKAPLQPGDSLVINGIRIINVGDKNQDKALITKVIDPRTEIKIKADVAKKKSTITCVKGKLTKKTIGVVPKCPAGYKKA